MDVTIEELALRTHASLSSLKARAKHAFQMGLDLYSPERWLVIYYPLYYLSKIAKRDTEETSERGQGSSLRSVSTSVTFQKGITLALNWIVFALVIVASVYYVLSLSWHLLESTLSKRSDEDAVYDATNKAPNSLLQTDVDMGLTKDEVLKRQKIYGPNEITTSRKWFNVWLRLSAMPKSLVLEVSNIYALYFRDWTDSIILCGLLMFHLAVSIANIMKYDDFAKTRAGTLVGYHDTRREGVMKRVLMRDLVPGDIVYVKEGQTIMFEGQIIKRDSPLIIDQSAIVPQDLPVSKSVGDTCYPATGVIGGAAFLIVTAIGHYTYIGRTLATHENPMSTHDQKLYATPRSIQIREYYRMLSSTAIGIGMPTTVALSVIWTSSHYTKSPYRMFHLFIGLAVLIHTAYTNDTLRFLRFRSVRRFFDHGAHLQTNRFTDPGCLAGIDIFCSDKTGTLTLNQLSVKEPYSISGDMSDLILTACLSGSPDREKLDPIESAILKALDDHAQAKESLTAYQINGYVSFDLKAKRSWAWAAKPSGGRSMLCTKGGPKAILDLCASTPSEIAKDYRDMCSSFARRGYRTLGIARMPEGGEWQLLGLLPLYDPVRDDTASAIKMAKELGVTVKMMTGDATVIAQKAAESLGLGTSIVDSSTYDDQNSLGDPKICAQIETADCYAELFPEHKERMVRILQRRGHRVAVTGDGVLDAYALQKADCAIAAQGSTEIAISASDLYMATSGLSAMIRTLQISRQEFRVMWIYVAYRTTISLHLICIMLGYFAAYNEAIDPLVIMLNVHISDIIGIFLRHGDRHTPFSKNPVTWSAGRLMTTIMAVSAIFAIGTYWLLAALPPHNDAATLSAIRQQAIFLLAILSQQWPYLICRVNGCLKVQFDDWRAISLILAVGIFATFACNLGFIGGGHLMSIEEAIRVWRYSLATVGIAMTLRVLVLDEELVEMS